MATLLTSPSMADAVIIASLIKPQKGEYQIRCTDSGVYLHKLDQDKNFAGKLMFIPDSDIIAINTAKMQKNVLILYTLSSNRKKTQLYLFSGLEAEIAEFIQEVRKILHFPSKGRKIAVLVNPIGGKKIGRKLFKTCLKPMLHRVGLDYDYFETDSATYIDDWVRKTDLCKYTEVVCVGGDGLVNQYLNAIYSQHDSLRLLKIPIGIIPAGSQNALACSLSGKNPLSASAHIIRQRTNNCDIMKIKLDDQILLATTAISWGILSDISSTAESWRIFGPARYTLCGARKLLTPMKHYKTTIKYTLSEPQVENIAVEPPELRNIRSQSISLASLQESQRVASAIASDTESVNLSDSGLDIEEHLDDRKEVMVHTMHSAVELTTQNSPRTTKKKENKKEYALLEKETHATEPEEREEKSVTRKGSSASRSPSTEELQSRRSEIAIEEDMGSVVSGDDGDASDIELHDIDVKRARAVMNPLEYSYRMPNTEQTLEVDTSVTILSIVNHTVRSSLGEDIYAPRGKINDGCLDMILLPRTSKCKIIRFLTGIRNKGSHINVHRVQYQKLKAIKIELQTKLAFNIDGEHYHSTKAKVDVLPGLVKMYGIPF